MLGVSVLQILFYITIYITTQFSDFSGWPQASTVATLRHYSLKGVKTGKQTWFQRQSDNYGTAAWKGLKQENKPDSRLWHSSLKGVKTGEQTWFQRQSDMEWFSKTLHPAPCHLAGWFWLAEEPERPANHHAPSSACPRALVVGQGILEVGQAERNIIIQNMNTLFQDKLTLNKGLCT